MIGFELKCVEDSLVSIPFGRFTHTHNQRERQKSQSPRFFFSCAHGRCNLFEVFFSRYAVYLATSEAGANKELVNWTGSLAGLLASGMDFASFEFKLVIFGGDVAIKHWMKGHPPATCHLEKSLSISCPFRLHLTCLRMASTTMFSGGFVGSNLFPSGYLRIQRDRVGVVRGLVLHRAGWGAFWRQHLCGAQRHLPRQLLALCGLLSFGGDCVLKYANAVEEKNRLLERVDETTKFVNFQQVSQQKVF